MFLKERATDVAVQTEGEVVIDGNDPLLKIIYKFRGKGEKFY